MRHLSAWAAAFLFFAGFFLAFFDFWGDTPGPEFRGNSRERGPRSPANRARGFDSPLGARAVRPGAGARGRPGARRGRRAFFLRAGGAAAGLRGAHRARGAAATSCRAKAGGAGQRRGEKKGGACAGTGGPRRARARRAGGCPAAGRAARRGGTRGQIRRAGRRGQIRRARGARRRFFWRGADFWGRRAKKSPFLLYKEAGFFARFSLSDQS